MKWIIRSNDFISSPLEAEVIACDKSESMSRGVGQLLKFGGIGFLCVFIPVLHFFLVPAFIGIGIYSLIKGLKCKYRIEKAGFAICPCCQKKVELKSLWFESQVRFNCQHCSEQLVLEQR